MRIARIGDAPTRRSSSTKLHEFARAGDVTRARMGTEGSSYGGERAVRQFLAFSGAAPGSSGGVVDLDRGFGGLNLQWTKSVRTASRCANRAPGRRSRHRLPAPWRFRDLARMTWMQAEFRDYLALDGSVLSSNRLPGMPKSSLFAEATWHHAASGFAAGVETSWSGRIAVDDANSEHADSYAVANLRAAFDLHAAGWKEWDYQRVACCYAATHVDPH